MKSIRPPVADELLMDVPAALRRNSKISVEGLGLIVRQLQAPHSAPHESRRRQILRIRRCLPVVGLRARSRGLVVVDGIAARAAYADRLDRGALRAGQGTDFFRQGQILMREILDPKQLPRRI